MYYEEVVTGFPEHSLTGFETITLVEQGYVDHFDTVVMAVDMQLKTCIG